MIELLLKFILAHLLGDFILQPDKWVKDKKDKKIKSPYLYFHIFVHFLLLVLLTQFSSKYIFSVILITLSHFIIDLGKIYIEKEKKQYFLIDQILHIFLIIGVVYYFFPFTISLATLFEPKILLILTTLTCLTYPTSMITKITLSKWGLTSSKNQKGINNAGKYIGILERLFIFLFISINFWEGIGFLLAAKSIFRFGDLKESKEVEHTEYILIGTLLSFGIGISISLMYKYFLTIL